MDLPRNKVRRTEGDSRRRLDSDDILELWTALDAAKAPLPTFAAIVQAPTADIVHRYGLMCANCLHDGNKV